MNQYHSYYDFEIPALVALVSIAYLFGLFMAYRQRKKQ